MKTLITFTLITLGAFMAEATPSDDLINAIIEVESNGDDSAVGDSGRAVGCMQIWKVVIDDVNAVSDTQYSYDDRLDRSKSIEIFKIYIGRYATTKRLGRTPTDEDMARIWNGGPNGYKKTATRKYWSKVQAIMEA